VTLCRGAETVLGRGDLWKDNIKMKLAKHDVLVWAGFVWLGEGVRGGRLRKLR
jgi:hypothetical protein